MGESGEEGAVYELLDLGGGFIDIAANDVEFGRGWGVFVAEADVDAFAAGGVDGIGSGVFAAWVTTAAMSSRGTRIFMGPTWTSRASPSSLRTTLPVRPMDLSWTVSPSETRATRWGLCVLVAAVGSGGVGDDGLIELLAEFAASLGDAALGFLAELLGGGAVLHGGDGLAGVVLEVAQERVELLLQITNLFALLFEALGFEAAALAGNLLLALTQVQALGFNLAEIGVEAVEEGGDVLRSAC